LSKTSLSRYGETPGKHGGSSPGLLEQSAAEFCTRLASPYCLLVILQSLVNLHALGFCGDLRRSSACRFYIALRGGLRSLNSSLLGRVNSRTAIRTRATSSSI